LFALIAVAFAVPEPKPQVVYTSAAYPAAVSYSNFNNYRLPYAYAPYVYAPRAYPYAPAAYTYYP
jgi:hypothetical protein